MEAPAGIDGKLAAETEVAPPDYSTNNVKKASLHSTLAAVLEDPILSDVPKSQIYPTLAFLQTSCMQIYDAIFSDIHVAVMNSATVKDFKLIVEKKVNEWSNLRWAIDKFLGGMSVRTFVFCTTMKGSLMIMLHFRIMALRTTLRCNLFHMLDQGLLKSIPGGKNTGFFRTKAKYIFQTTHRILVPADR
ncbi:hypothetical protein M9H77_18699 [Catharanthus roseus]|uniref:Uncharacterized protein n=1 Tax=Catharanthus roseus TaxID=4058 RepID=A0ACC0B873_CATRO|nr:hypothetical protein M9H77_18699 [Catharanthus roseus]